MTVYDNEEWKEHPTLGIMVSDRGRVIGKSGKILSASRHGHGYLKVGIEGKSKCVHKLVAETWIPNPNNFPCVCHGRGGMYDNSTENLSWGTYKKNAEDRKRDGTQAGLQVIRSDGVKYPTARDAAIANNIDNAQLLAVCHGRMKSAGGYGWKFNPANYEEAVETLLEKLGKDSWHH